VVDPRTIYHQADTELVALWLAHFGLKNGDSAAPSAPPTADLSVDQQVSACERILL